jgi:hypothetical protein
MRGGSLSSSKSAALGIKFVSPLAVSPLAIVRVAMV